MDATEAMGDARASAALSAEFDRCRARLRRMVEVRMDRRVRAAVDPSDIVQEGFAEIARRRAAGQADPALPPFLWFRMIVGERLLKAHRRHLGTRQRDRTRELPLAESVGASSACLAWQLVSREDSPSAAAQRADRVQRIEAALESLDEIDREALALRYFEGLSRTEAAAALGIAEEAVAKRYGRALRRLRAALAAMDGGLEAL